MAARFYQFLGQNSGLNHLIKSKGFTIIMLVVVISNTLVMIFETYDFYYRKYISFFLIMEKIYLCIYIIECSLKLWVYSWRYFRILWNCFDLFVIIVGMIDLITQELIHDSTPSSLQLDYTQQTQNHLFKFLRVLRVLRSFRALRVLRTIRFIQPIHTIVKTSSKALPAMASITFIMIIITCISAIIARSLFGDICPEKFNNLVQTFFSLFTLLTLDDWYSVYEVCSEREYASFQLIFCLIYILISNFILLNLLMAVVVDSFQQTLDHDMNKYERSEMDMSLEERMVNNLTQLAEEYCVEKKLEEEKSVNEFEEDRRKRSLRRIEEMMKRYYMLMESLEFRMERHEQLTKLTQKSIKMTLIEQDDRKVNTKR